MLIPWACAGIVVGPAGESAPLKGQLRASRSSGRGRAGCGSSQCGEDSGLPASAAPPATAITVAATAAIPAAAAVSAAARGVAIAIFLFKSSNACLPENGVSAKTIEFESLCHSNFPKSKEGKKNLVKSNYTVTQRAMRNLRMLQGPAPCLLQGPAPAQAHLSRLPGAGESFLILRVCICEKNFARLHPPYACFLTSLATLLLLPGYKQLQFPHCKCATQWMSPP